MTIELLNTYFSYFGINHLQCSVAHAQSNSTVERFNRNVEKYVTVS